MNAMVLCAGFGTRLGALTAELPKAMLSLGEATVIEHVVRHLADQGFADIAVNLHFQAELLRRHLGNGDRFGVRLQLITEAQPTGTAGGVRALAGAVDLAHPFLVHYGDVVTNQDFRQMMSFHARKEVLATILVHRRRRSNSIVVVGQDDRVSRFLERPGEEQFSGLEETLVFSGIAVLSPAVLDLVPADGASDLPRDVFPALAEAGQLAAFPLDGYRVAVDSEVRLLEARAVLANAHRLDHPP